MKDCANGADFSLKANQHAVRADCLNGSQSVRFLYSNVCVFRGLADTKCWCAVEKAEPLVEHINKCLLFCVAAGKCEML